MANPIAGINSPSSGGGAQSTLGSIASQKDQFLKLLLAQLKNQDPLQPPDASKFSEEMIQFGQLEQLFNLNSTIDKLGTLDKSTLRTQAVSMIGKQVSLDGSVMEYDPARKTELGFKLQAPVDGMEIQLANPQGEIVRTIRLTDKVRTGTHYLPFDGLNDAGEPLAAGNYQVMFNAGEDESGQALATGVIQGTVDGVDFAGENILLRVRGQHIPMDQILGVQS